MMALAVSATGSVDGLGVVYAGTEPSAPYRSEDGGEYGRELTGLSEVPSAMISQDRISCRLGSLSRVPPGERRAEKIESFG